MKAKFKKIISILTILILIIFQSGTTWALETPAAPTPPPQETVIPAPSPVPEAPTPPPAPTLETATPEPTPTQPEPSPSPAPQSEQTSNPESNESTNSDSQPPTESLPQSDNLSGETADGVTGDPEINTGDATTTGVLTNTGNNNVASGNEGSGNTDGASASNIANGTGSDNSSSIVSEENSTTIQDNLANVDNSLDLESVTGENSASKNVGDSTIATGDANTTGIVINALNTNLAGASVSEFNVTDNQTGDLVLDFAANCISGCNNFLNSLNEGNGANSSNNSQILQTVDNTTFQTNDASLLNTLTLTADSGNNETSKNTGGDSSITTGDASVAATVLNFVNNNVAGNVLLGVVNIFGDLIGDIILPDELVALCESCGGDTTASNINNGSDSTNNALIDQDSTTQTFQNNDISIENNLILDANTGDNESSKNTGGDSSIETGTADVNAQVVNVANSNVVGDNWWLVIINQAGQWIGKILGAPEGSNFAGSSGTDFTVNPNGEITATNSGNGAGSTNNATANTQQNQTISQTNSGTIVNNLNLTANTGGNKASQNTGGDSNIKTGDAEIIANIINFANNNIVGGGKMVVTVVNVFGKWLGDFVTPGNKKEAAAAQNTAASDPPNQNSNPASPQSNSNSSSNNSDSQTTTQAANTATAPNNTISIDAHASGTISNPIIAFAGKAKDTAAQVAGMKIAVDNPINTQVKENSPKKITINLAWGLLLLPLGITAIIVKRRLH